MGPKRLKRITKLNHFHHQEIMIDCIFFARLTNSEFSLQKCNGFPETFEFLSSQIHSWKRLDVNYLVLRIFIFTKLDGIVFVWDYETRVRFLLWILTFFKRILLTLFWWIWLLVSLNFLDKTRHTDRTSFIRAFISPLVKDKAIIVLHSLFICFSSLADNGGTFLNFDSLCHHVRHIISHIHISHIIVHNFLPKSSKNSWVVIEIRVHSISYPYLFINFEQKWH